MLPSLLLCLHLAIIVFNVFGLIVIPIGVCRGWEFVREPVWRWLHLGSLAIVAIQAILGRACFLTILQDRLTVGPEESQPLIARWIDSMIYWSLPIWVFATAYSLIFAYVVALMWWAPPRPLRRS